MKQASLNLDLLSKKTHKQTFLDEMEKVVPWADLEALIAPYYCEGVKGRPPFALQTVLRTHFMQQWFTLSDPAMEEAFVDTPLYRQFAQIEEFTRLLDKAEKLKAGVRAKVEHPFRVIKRQFGFVKVRYRGLKKNTQQLFTLFALSNLWMVRGKLTQMQA